MNLSGLIISTFRPSSLFYQNIGVVSNRKPLSQHCSCSMSSSSSLTAGNHSGSKRDAKVVKQNGGNHKLETGQTLSSKQKRQRKSNGPLYSPISDETNLSKEECVWFNVFTENDPLYIHYMTHEWGVEKQTDQQLFEMLSLEGAQAGLSWRTILHKRDAYRTAFHQFDIDTVAAMTNENIDALLSQKDNDSTNLVVRHKGKLQSVVNNAKIILSMRAKGDAHVPSTSSSYSPFSDFLWSFVNHRPILNQWRSFSEIPNKTEESEKMSKELKKLGFKFVGPTIMYAFMQSCGFVIDHPVDTKGWIEAERRLKERKGGYQIR